MLEEEVTSLTEKFSEAKLDAMYSGDPTEEQTLESPDNTLSIVLSANDSGVHAVVHHNAVAIMSIFYSTMGNDTCSFLPRSNYDTRINNLIVKKLGLSLDSRA